MTKKIILVFFFFFFFLNANASVSRPTITSISYDGNLSEDTIIEITGTNLEDCTSLSIKGTEILIQSINDTKITYNFNSGNFINGFIDLTCGEHKGSKEFIFPFIESVDVDVDNIERVYWITGKNLLNGSKVYLGSGKNISFNKRSDVLIIGDIPDNPTSNDFFILYNGLKSNIYNIDLKAPHINYIEAKNGFIPGEKVILYGENFDIGSNGYILIEDTEIDNYEYNEEKESIEFTLPNLLGDSTISFFGGGVGSNEIDIFILGERPNIKNGYIKGEYINDKYTKVLYLVGDGFTISNELIYVYNNGFKTTIDTNDEGIIKVADFELSPGNNFINLQINGIQSNIINIYNDENNPYISSINVDGIDGSKRIVKLGLGDFDPDTDYIYYNGSRVTPSSCLSESCKVKISSSSLTGYFSVAKPNGKKSLNKYFDFTDGKYPVIYDIKFESDIKSGTKFLVSGINFDDASITVTNINDLENLDISNETIEGRFSYDYNSASTSQIKIKKYGVTSIISFIGSELTRTKYNGHGLIKSIKNSNGDKSIKQGDTLIINGYGFHFDSIILVGSKEYNVSYISPVEVSIKLLNDISIGNHAIKVKNTLGNTSEEYNIKIFSSDYEENVDLVFGTKTSKELLANENYTKEFMYSFNINNYVDDLTITQLEYQFKNYNSNIDLGTFELRQGSTVIGKSQVDNKGVLEFENFIINQNTSGNTFSLYKTSPFYYYGDYEMTINDIEGYYRGTNQKVNNFNFSTLDTFNFTITDNNLYMCVDSLDDNSNCKSNGIDQKEIITETKKTETINNTNNSEIIYKKVDGIIDDYISKVSKQSLKSQLNTYKDFKISIKSIISRNQNSPLLEYLEYFYDKIDIQFKIVFKEYFKSQK